MAYLSPEQITGQVLLNMHENDKGQLVTSSNLRNINLRMPLSINILDGGKIYSKYVEGGSSRIESPLIHKLMNSVTELTLAFWLYNPLYSSRDKNYYLRILDGYIILSGNETTKNLDAEINYKNEVNLTHFDDEGDPWKHIAVVLHNRKFTFYVNGTKQADIEYSEYEDSEYNNLCEFYFLNTDDLCLILNQAIWTDNFTPPEEPLLGDLKYKTVLYPKFQRLYQNEDKALLKLY